MFMNVTGIIVYCFEIELDFYAKIFNKRNTPICLHILNRQIVFLRRHQPLIIDGNPGSVKMGNTLLLK